jgi:type I restriction enzyme S subunit
MVALLNEQKQVIISELVNRGLNPDVPMRDSGVLGLGEIPASWELVRAKSIWRPVVSRSQTGLEQLLSVSSKFGPVPRKNLNVTMFMANSYVGHKRVRVNDLVINSLWSWAYGLGVSKHEGLVSTAYSVFELINPTVVDPDYMNYLLRSAPMQWQFQVNSKGIWKSRLQLTDSSFGSFTLPLPPTDEQRAIASSIEIKTKNIEDAIVAVEREIELLKEYRTVLISDVVTGKKDVRAEAAELSDIDPAELAQVLSGAVSDDGEEDEDDGASENE